MSISSIFKINKGITAIIGGGGKTSLMYALARELALKDRVILCTSTKIYPPRHIPVVFGEKDIPLAFERSNAICVGTLLPYGKLSSPNIPFSKLESLCGYVIVEADGSRQLPFKAHAFGEPSIPPNSHSVILTVGASAFNKPIKEACHRLEKVCSLLNKSPGDLFTVFDAAHIINTENLHDIVFINQVESEDSLKSAGTLAQLLKTPVIAGSLKEAKFKCL